MSLRAEGLVKRYGSQTVLDHCSLTVTAGQCLQLRGPSGGGKSTMLRVLALLEDADAGEVFHNDRRWVAQSVPPDVSTYPFLTVVFQQLFLWPNLTVAQNIAMVLQHDPNALLDGRATDLLDRFSLRRLVQRLPHECSLGERQRIALARALASKAEYLLLDEPSSALDSHNRGILVELLADAKASGRGLLVITHDDQTFDRITDESLLLENGRLSAR